MPTSYVTVAIPYVNAEPHLGYAYELVLADIHARACRLDGRATRFVGGTDDHSLKNVLAAEAAGVPIRALVAANAARFAGLRDPLELSFDDFITTSDDPRHVPAVHRLWQAALDAGDLYRHLYDGDYCVGCERFFTAEELDDGRCPEHGDPVERVVEENWFFRLSRYTEVIEQCIVSGRVCISPESFRNEALAFVRRGLEDISVSRSVARARGWGVPVPNDGSQVISVWFDALANYVSTLDFGEPDAARYRRWWSDGDERTHVVGKGILRFHAVYWLAFLTAAGQPLPTHLRVHPYLTVDGVKLSKSSGPRIDPAQVAETYGSDALRWWFARQVNEVADTDFSVERLVECANADLAGGIGNTINRIVSLVHRFRGGVVPTVSDVPGELTDLLDRVRGLVRDFELRRATAAIVEAVHQLNQDIERTEPWKLARDATLAPVLDASLARFVAAAQLIARALEPIVPTLSSRATAALTAAPTAPPTLPPAEPLVPRLEVEDVGGD